MHWVLYAMFMFHPENNVAWRVTEEINFKSLMECQYFYYENENTLINGLKNHMASNFGPINNGKYSLMELGCIVRSSKGPIITRRVPLSSTSVIEDFKIKKIDI